MPDASVTAASMLLGALATIEAGLSALEIPHGKGALESAAAVIGASGGPGTVTQTVGIEALGSTQGGDIRMVNARGKL